MCQFHICATFKRNNSIQAAEHAMCHFEASWLSHDIIHYSTVQE